MDATVAELYRVFEPYRLGDFSGCEHCVLPRDSERLVSKPLRDLDFDDLNRYAFKAMTTWGTEQDFKHFLPRLFELALDSYLSFDFPETLIGKLKYAKWTIWPKVEKDAVETFLRAFWEHQLQLSPDLPDDDRIQTALGGLAEACDSVILYLDIWEKAGSQTAALHLAQFIDGLADEIMTTGRIRLWGESTDQCAEIVRWLRSDRAQQLVLHFRNAVLAVFPLAVSQLDGIRSAILSDSPAPDCR